MSMRCFSVKLVVQVSHITASVFLAVFTYMLDTYTGSLAELSQEPSLPGSCLTSKNLKDLLYLEEDVRCIMHTHDHTASSYHVVTIGESDEKYGSQMVDKHNHEILPSEKQM